MNTRAFLGALALCTAGCSSGSQPTLCQLAGQACGGTLECCDGYVCHGTLCAAVSVSDGGTGDAGSVARGPLALSIDGDPEGLWWDPSGSTLYVADQENNRVLTWTDDGGFALLANLAGPPDNDLGGLVRLADGTIVVVEFGFGTAGQVDYVLPDGGVGIVPNLDPTKRRLGITVAPDGTLYDSFFYKLSGGQTGFVAQLDIEAGTETDVVTTSLEKPVGVLAVGTELYVSDQSEDEVFDAPLANPATLAALCTAISPDLLSAGPAGTIFSGSPSGVEYQIDTSTGVFNALFTASGSLEPRGSAYDASHQRLFVGEHDGSGNEQNYVEIVPVNE